MPTAEQGAPGHPLYVHPGQGKGRWDNPDLYRLRYVALTPEAAIGETFGNLARWSPDMLRVPFLSGAERQLATYSMDETIHPLLDFDDAKTLIDRGLRPTQVVGRNRPLTSGIAARVFREGRWAGVRWWSYHRPQ